jgi:hypothetical protein
MPCSTAIPVIGRVDDLPLDDSGRLCRGELRIERAYQLRKGSKRIPLPATVTPSLQPEDLRCLNLEIDWTDPFTEDCTPEIKEIEELELHVPVAWGRAVHLMPEGALFSKSADRRHQTITWKKVPIRKEWRDNGRGTFSIEFEFDLINEKKQDKVGNISGLVKLAYDQTFSGLEGFALYESSGIPLQTQRTSLETTKHRKIVNALIDFDSGLACLDYHLSHRVPESREWSQQREKVFVFSNVIPDHEIVINLTNVLSSNEYYVRRIIEEQPNVDAGSKRSWEIIGRRYRGVWPIDFGLELSGETNTQGRSARASLKVRGGYCNPEMKEHIENAWEQLKVLIHTTMSQYQDERSPRV